VFEELQKVVGLWIATIGEWIATIGDTFAKEEKY